VATGHLPSTGTIAQTCQQIAKVLGGLPPLTGNGLPSGGPLIPLPSLGGP